MIKATLTVVGDKHHSSLEVYGKTRKECAGKVQEEVAKSKKASYSIFLKRGESPKFEEVSDTTLEN